MSRDKLLCPKRTKKQEKDVPKQEKDVPKQEKDVLKEEKYVLKQKRTFQNRKRCSETGNHRKKFHFINVFSFVSVPRDVPGRDGTSCQNPVPSRPVAKFWACPVVPLSRDKEEIAVPFSRKVALSRSVGNPTLNCSLLLKLFSSSGGSVTSTPRVASDCNRKIDRGSCNSTTQMWGYNGSKCVPFSYKAQYIY